jgi:hypothetical protein
MAEWIVGKLERKLPTSDEIGRFLFEAAASWAAGSGEKRPLWDDASEAEKEGMREVASALAKYLGAEVKP